MSSLSIEMGIEAGAQVMAHPFLAGRLSPLAADLAGERSGSLPFWDGVKRVLTLWLGRRV